MEKTQPVDWIGKPFEGYVINVPFPEENSTKVISLIDKIAAAFGDAVYCMPKESLHITLLDWVAPLVAYDGQDKQALFESIYEGYDTALSSIFAEEESFSVTFDTITVAPTTIFISGHDNGQFERIRNKYLDTVELLPDTKRPPTIIHSSLARFTQEIDLSAVRAFMEQQSIDLHQRIDTFRLVHTRREPMLEFEVLKTYGLSTSPRS